MIVQKVIRIGSSLGITLPTKELKRQNIELGDDIEVTIRRVRPDNDQDQAVRDAAKQILRDYHDDFEHLADR